MQVVSGSCYSDGLPDLHAGGVGAFGRPKQSALPTIRNATSPPAEAQRPRLGYQSKASGPCNYLTDATSGSGLHQGAASPTWTRKLKQPGSGRHSGYPENIMFCQMRPTSSSWSTVSRLRPQPCRRSTCTTCTGSAKANSVTPLTRRWSMRTAPSSWSIVRPRSAATHPRPHHSAPRPLKGKEPSLDVAGHDLRRRDPPGLV